MTKAQTAASQGYVLGATEGEHLVHFRDAGNIFIKVGPPTGSDSLALGTQQVTVGAGIPIHEHLRMDEAFYVLEGCAIFTLNDSRRPCEEDGTIFIPKNCSRLCEIGPAAPTVFLTTLANSVTTRS